MKAFSKVWLGIGLIAIGLGLCLLFLASVIGVSWRRSDTYSFAEHYQDVHSLDILINYGEVKVVEGKEFRIDAYNLYESGEFTSKVRDGIWIIEETYPEQINILGMHLPVTNRMGKYNAPEIIITVPEDFHAEDISINLKAGSLGAEVIRSNTGSFRVDAGKMSIDQLEVTKESSYQVGAGYMELNNVNVSNITVNCGVGYIEMDGKIYGDNEVRCNVGKIKMDLIGDMDKYSFRVDSDIGNVIMNGKDYRNKTIQNKAKENAEGSFLLDCNIGNITLDIYE